MNILAIETSCDETAAAVVRDGWDVRSSVLSSQIKVHRKTGGVVPEVAARLQLQMIIPVVDQALAEAESKHTQGQSLGMDAIDAIAVTQGPGLIGSLLVGVETAKALAYAQSKPLIGINHLAGHLYACFQPLLSSRPDSSRSLRSSRNNIFKFPYLGLIVSGGHTELVLMTSHHRFELLGSTRDDAAGEAFDKIGRLLGLATYPGGPEVSRLAESGNPKAIDFPRAMLDQDNFDFSFSGLKTAVLQECQGQPLTKQQKADVAASFQQAVVDALVIKTLRAANQYKPTAVLLGGGVAANQLLRRQLKEALKESKIELLVTPPEMATDNAAMIGLAAYWHKNKPLQDKKLSGLAADPGLRIA